jgi:hypothetical protein
MTGRRCTHGYLWCVEETSAEDPRDPATRGEILHSSGQLSAVEQTAADHPVTLTIGQVGDDEPILTVAGSYLTPTQALRYARDLRRAALAAAGGWRLMAAARVRRMLGAVGRWLVRVTGLRVVRVQWVEATPHAGPSPVVAAFEAGRRCERHVSRLAEDVDALAARDRHPAGHARLRVVRDGPPDAS